MKTTFEATDIEQILGEADELLKQINSELIEDMEEEQRAQFEEYVQSLKRLKSEVQGKIEEEGGPESSSYSEGMHEAIEDILKAFVIPGLGQMVVLGPLAMMIVGALEGAAVTGGLSALGAGLYSLGIPKDSIVKYETALKSDKFLVHGSRPPRMKQPMPKKSSSAPSLCAKRTASGCGGRSL